jgi:TPR repeat protein
MITNLWRHIVSLKFIGITTVVITFFLSFTAFAAENPNDGDKSIKWKYNDSNINDFEVEGYNNFQARLKEFKNNSNYDGEYSQKLYELWIELGNAQSYQARPVLDVYSRFLYGHEQQELVYLLEQLEKNTDDLEVALVLGDLKYKEGKSLLKNNGNNIGTWKFLPQPEDKFREALVLFKKSSIYAPSNKSIGEIYENGYGVDKSKYVAIDYYYAAANIHLSNNDRDEALNLLEKINILDASHILAKQLYNKLYGKSDDENNNKDKKLSSSGTGWICEYGYIATNYHVIEGHQKIYILRNNKRYIAQLIAKDKLNDIAILKIKNPDFLLKIIPLSTARVSVAKPVGTIGFPHTDIMGSSSKFTSGEISSLYGIEDDPRTFQISVPVQAGNSGGPLINSNGEVIGIVASKLNAAKIFNWTGDLPQNVNYAIKVEYLKALLNTVAPTQYSDILPKNATSWEELYRRIQGSVFQIISEN